ALVRGPDHYVFCDDPATPPQAIIHPDQRCTTPDGEEVEQMRSFGVRRWGNSPDGSSEVLTGTYNLEGEVSRRLLDALPERLVLRADDWETPLIALLADEMLRDEIGQDAVLDRLLDLLLVAAVRAHLTRTAAAAPGWFRAQSDPMVSQAVRLLQDNPAEAWTLATLARQTHVSRATLARRFSEVVGQPPMEFLTEWRLPLAADLLRAPPRPARAAPLGPTEMGLPPRPAATRRLQPPPRPHPGPTPPPRTPAHRLCLTESSGATAAAGNSWRSEARMRRRVAAGIIA